jgi:hypothetical protein
MLSLTRIINIAITKSNKLKYYNNASKYPPFLSIT